jgi:hypothetical protein
MTSTEPLPDRCGAECRDGGYCENYPKGDGDRCRMHGHDGGAPEGQGNGNYDHGAFSEHWRSDLTDAEEQALDALVSHLESIDDERSLAAEVAAEALLKYKRSADSRFLREARQWFDDFNLLPNADELELSGADGGALEVVVERSEYDGD